MIDRIADELKRDDLGSSTNMLLNTQASIANAILDAVLDYQREAFFINDATDEGITVPATVAGQNYYPLPDDLWALIQLDLIGNNVVQTLIEKSIQYIDTLDANALFPTQGFPLYYSIHENQARLYPTPNSTDYSLRYIYQKVIAAPVLAADSDFWTTRAESMIRNRAKYKLNIEVIRDQAAAQLDKQSELDALAGILRETQQKLFTRTLRATKF